MRVGCLPLAAVILFAGPALADPRITTHFYLPNEVVAIHGRGDTQSTIAFAPDERIENIAVGDSAGWQVAPNKRADLLFLKPTKAGARTNMTVVTDQRTYLFDLVSDGPRAAPVYMMRFTYPAPPPKPIPEKPIPEKPIETVATPPVQAAHPQPDPATLDFAWTTRGDKSLLPSHLFDDGHSTFLAWPKDQPLPAILTGEAKGSEGPVNYTTWGDYIVVDGVPAQIILRSGKQVATLMKAPSDSDAGRRIAGPRVAMSRVVPSRPFAHVLDGRP
jgi:type IV secretion system protein VirB9